jgi:glycosyltransferase involved in cell wall biosynthesis
VNTPLVSVIVPTKNSARFLRACLSSIEAQTYRPIEIIVVDNHSTDETRQIASSFTAKVLTAGPERSAQVNFGARNAEGEFVYKVDSDFVLDSTVVASCVRSIDAGADAVVVHNSPDVTVGWIAVVRKFEVDMYKYDLAHSSARFLKKTAFAAVGGYNETITAGEDYDFQNRLNKAGFRTEFVDAEAVHLGEPTSFLKHMIKYFVYGKDFVMYRNENRDAAGKQLAFVRGVYIRNWRRFIRHPLLGATFIAYSTCKFAFGAAGFATASIRARKRNASARQGL